MNLTLFFRLILISIFQKTSNNKAWDGQPLSYDNSYFFCPSVVAKDGWRVSLQINNGNYCSSINGYRTLGHTITSVEWGFSSEHEPLLDATAEQTGDSTQNVGSIELAAIEAIFEKHGGIDWEATISIHAFNKLIK